MPEIKVRILKHGAVEWKKMKFIQPDALKTFSDDAKRRLKASLVSNNFVTSFKVWQRGDDVFCLDGFHRTLVLRELESEGSKIPAKLPAEFIQCRDEREAAKLVVVYSAQYADISREQLNAFAEMLGVDLLALDDEVRLMLSDGEAAVEEMLSERTDGAETQPEYPLAAKFGEQYDYVVVFTTNEIDRNNLHELLGLKKEQSYKSSLVGTGRVISYADFVQRWGAKR